MPSPRKSAGRAAPARVPPWDGKNASGAEAEFQRVTGIARTRLNRGELSGGAYTVIVGRAKKSRDTAADDLGPV